MNLSTNTVTILKNFSEINKNILVKFSKKLFEKIDFSSIVSLNTMGETEKTILNTNKNKISTVLLEHGASDYLEEFSRYDVTSGYRNPTFTIINFAIRLAEKIHERLQI